jgi:hypothetical protein
LGFISQLAWEKGFDVVVVVGIIGLYVILSATQHVLLNYVTLIFSFTRIQLYSSLFICRTSQIIYDIILLFTNSIPS